MTPQQWTCTLRGASYLLALAVLLAGFCQPAAAQNIEQVHEIEYEEETIECISAILASTSDYEIDTYGETQIFYYGEWDGYGAYVESYLYSNNSVIDEAWDEDDEMGIAAIEMADSVELGNTYLLVSYHYLDDGDCDLWSIDSTNASVVAGTPYITTIDPFSAQVGTSVAINVYGDNLIDPFTDDIDPSIAGAGFTFNSASGYSSPVTVNYSIALNASTGNLALTLSNRFGTSNGATFNVYDPPPSISSIAPSSWDAGTSPRVVISGTGFGTNPLLTISPASAQCQNMQASDNGAYAQITCPQMVTSVNASGPLVITVTSQGYNGTGFAQRNPPVQNSANGTVTINPVQGPPPAPQILMGPNTEGANLCSDPNAQNITNQSVPILVGAPVGFTACIPSSVPLSQVTSESWSPIQPNSSKTVAGFSVVATPQGCGPAENQTPCNYTRSLTQVTGTSCGIASSCDFNKFFFFAPDSETFTYTYTVQGGGQATAYVTFTASGPTGVNVTLDPGYTGDPFSPVTVYGDSYNNPWMGLGQYASSSGYGLWLQAYWTAPTTPPWNGNLYSLSWVQVFTNMTFRKLDGQGTWTGHFAGQVSPSGGIYSTVLDTYYPYQSGSRYFDDPRTILEDAEYSENYSSTVYLMWDPAIGTASCQPANTYGDIASPTQCASIPVPLGHISWTACGDAVNTLTLQLSTETNWTLGCSSQTPHSSFVFVPDTTYPSWQSTIHATDFIQWVNQ
ncbi:MAG: hypothetical protein P4N24_02640 [Acidobacteriota bacterium]|nr:hypothetical protein [Acidobacteriota bacterium]